MQSEHFAQHALAAGGAGWKAGHMAVRSGRFSLNGIQESEYESAITAYAAPEARAYMDDRVESLRLTPAQGVRLWSIFIRTYMKGVLDEALDGGALYHQAH